MWPLRGELGVWGGARARFERATYCLGGCLGLTGNLAVPGLTYSSYLANDAHVVTVDPATGRSYCPVLGASGGHPAVLVCEIT